jgi:TetR/AcrR family transcriptional repressor of nem operon
MNIDTKTALLNSAENAARSRGFDGFSYADLAQDVGIRKASVHYHFPTKAVLSLALMQRYQADIQDACHLLDAADISASARLSALIDRYMAALEGGKSLCLCVALSTSRDSLPAEVIDQIRQFRKMMVAWLQNVFEAGTADGSIVNVSNPKAEAFASLSLLEGAQLAARAEENLALFEQATELLRIRLR